jgi:hypothetical protein
MINRIAAVSSLILSMAVSGHAGEPVAQPQAVSASTGLQDEDIYYAPEENGDASGEMGASQGAVGSLAGSASYLSHAQIVPFEWGHPERRLEGVELFLNGQYLGKSPLGLDNFMVQRSALALTARKEGYEEAERATVKVPVDGPLRIALLNENVASWYTTPSWLLGLGLIAGSVAAYSGGSGSTGIGLAGGGVGVIALSQLAARLLHLPALRRQVDAYNRQTEAAP